MSGLLAPSAAPSPRAAEPAPLPAAITARAFLAGYAITLLVPLAGLAALLTGWALAHPTGWAVNIAAVIGWSAAATGWLRHRGWSSGTALLLVWAAPAALLAPLAGLGWLAAAGLVLWGPVSALLAVAVAAVYAPHGATGWRLRASAVRSARGAQP